MAKGTNTKKKTKFKVKKVISSLWKTERPERWQSRSLR
jgi:hypothetical protein